jgi:tetratricopeptide (TPR) repeat protein
MTGRVLRFPLRAGSSEEARAAARRILEASFPDRLSRAADLQIEDPETLLALGAFLRQQLDAKPAVARDEAEFLYRFIEKPKRAIGLFDERDYFLGEFALIAGTACRQLSRRDEARLWFDRAEASFRHTASSVAELSRLAYQRLALRMEERQIDAVLELAPPLADTFEKLSLPEDALKCRFLEGLALMESDQLSQSIDIFQDICRGAERLNNEKLLGSAYANLTHVHGLMGDSEKAIEASRKAIPVLRKLDDRVALAKVQWGLAALLREIGQIPAAIEAYRLAQQEFQQIGMRADIAALSLVVADLLLEVGRDQEARGEILSALPVIDELKMVPEGMAAQSLLRESIRQQGINRQALRDLHGYFDKLNS